MTRRLLLLNGIAALMIGFHHGTAYAISAMLGWNEGAHEVILPSGDQFAALTYFILWAIRQVDSFGVPAFLFVSGYFVSFLASREQGTVQLRLVMPRIKVFLIPFTFWTVVRFGMLRQVWGEPWLLVRDVLDTYYYIPLLIQLYVLSPLLAPLAKRNWRLLLLLAAVLQFGGEAARYLAALEITSPVVNFIVRATPRWFFLTHIFFFSLGIVFGVHIKAASAWLPKYKWSLLAVTVVAVALTLVEHKLVAAYMGREWMGRTFDTVSRLTYASTFSLCFVAFHQTALPFSKQLLEIGTRSLGIYFMNTPVVYVAGVLFYHFVPWLLDLPLLYFAIQTMLGVGVPLLLMEIVRRTPMRRVQQYAFG